MNDAVVQNGNTDEMIWDMHYLVADIARTITLEPGDVILSGTPANSRPCSRATSSRSRSRASGCWNTIVEGSVPVREDVGAQPTESESDLDGVRRRLGVRGVRSPRKD